MKGKARKCITELKTAIDFKDSFIFCVVIVIIYIGHMDADHGLTWNSFILHCVLQAFCLRKGVTQFVIQKYEKPAHSSCGVFIALFSYLTNHAPYGTVILNI